MSSVRDMARHWLGPSPARWLDNALEPILRETPAEVRLRERLTFDRLASPDPRNIVLAGAGALGKVTLDGLRSAGIEPLAFADNDPQLWGTERHGVRVYAPREAVERFGSGATFVVTIYNSSRVREQLRALGCPHVAPFAALFWKYAEVFIPAWGVDLPHRMLEQIDDIRAGYAVLADDASRIEFCEQLRWRYLLDFSSLSPPEDARQIYFPLDLVQPIPDEVLVDCGAYDGDTIRTFLAMRGESFRRILALEPDESSRAALAAFLAQLPDRLASRVTVLPFAAWDRDEKISFTALSTGSSSTMAGALEQQIEARPLDSLVGHDLPTFIKMDIEASEPAAINGARALLAAHAPVVAACVYHRSEHLWQIPVQLKKASEQYSVFLRRYAEESWETVCYAVPASRRPA